MSRKDLGIHDKNATVNPVVSDEPDEKPEFFEDERSLGSVAPQRKQKKREAALGSVAPQRKQKKREAALGSVAPQRKQKKREADIDGIISDELDEKPECCEEEEERALGSVAPQRKQKKNAKKQGSGDNTDIKVSKDVLLSSHNDTQRTK